jgi:hypothetical protein
MEDFHLISSRPYGAYQIHHQDAGKSGHHRLFKVFSPHGERYHILSMESVISIVGSFASLGGALWAFIEAKKSINAARKSEKVRDELINRRQMVEVSQVHSETSRILSVVSKVGPSCNAKLLKGVNCADIAKEIEVYARFILEQSGHFTDFFENKARELCDDLKDDIESLSEAIDFETKKKYGKSIYYKIQNFMPAVKHLSDEKRERALEQ